MKVYRGDTFSEVYEASLRDLMNNPEYETKPRDMKIKENTNVSLVVNNPLSCLYKNHYRSSQYRYISAELLWYFLGRNDVEFIKKYAKFWESIQNEDGTVNSSYGSLLFKRKNRYDLNQYSWAYQSLFKDKDSRQAVLHFNLPEHQYFANKDFVCTMYGIFQIRNNKLNFTTHMRSNDVTWGTPTDFAFFAILQSQLLSHLKNHAGYSDLELGTLTHYANSYHVYEHHFNIVDLMLSKPFIPDSIPAVEHDLIRLNGEPTSELNIVLNNLEFPLLLNDKLLLWIHSNLKEYSTSQA